MVESKGDRGGHQKVAAAPGGDKSWRANNSRRRQGGGREVEAAATPDGDESRWGIGRGRRRR